MGALAIAAHDHWVAFVDVVKPAYPHRSVELGGWPQGFTLVGGIMLLDAAFFSLVAFVATQLDRRCRPAARAPVALVSGPHDAVASRAVREPVVGVVCAEVAPMRGEVELEATGYVATGVVVPMKPGLEGEAY